VKRVATEYFGSDAMTIVVVGDKSTVLPRSTASARHPDERDAYGNPLSAATPATPKPAAPPAKPAPAPKK